MPPKADPIPAQNTKVSRWPYLLLGAVLALAAGLRWYGAAFGLPALNDPDELMFELGAVRMLTSGTLNPGWFGHPATTTMYVLALVNVGSFGMGWLNGTFAGPTEFMAAIYANPGLLILPGRLAMAVFGLLSVWQTWRIGTQLRAGRDGWTIGLFAALLLACSPVYIHYAQIIRSDMMGAAFMLLCIGAALRIADKGRRADYIWAALWLALAVASKWPFAISALAVAGASLHRVTLHPDDRREQLNRLAGFAVLAPVLLVAISPYLLLDFQTVLVNLTGEARTHHLGATGGSFFDNALWYTRGAIRAGLGVGGMILAAGGLVLIARDARLRLVLLPVLAAHLVIVFQADLRWERWMVPALPLLALSAGLAAAALAQRVRGWLGAKLANITLAVLTLAPAALMIPSVTEAQARMNDTRQQATHWVEANAPANAKIMIEHFAFDMINRAATTSFPLGEIGCVNAQAMLDGRIDYSLVDGTRKGRSKFDYGTMSPAVRATCVSDFYLVTEMERYRAERDKFPKETAAYEELLNDNVIVATFRPEAGVSVGPVVHVLARKPRA